MHSVLAPGTYLRNTRSRTDCNPEAKGVCTSHRSSHSEWLRQPTGTHTVHSEWTMLLCTLLPETTSYSCGPGSPGGWPISQARRHASRPPWSACAPADRRLVSTGYTLPGAPRLSTAVARLDAPPVPLEVEQGCASSLGVTLDRAYHRNSGLAALARAGVGVSLSDPLRWIISSGRSTVVTLVIASHPTLPFYPGVYCTSACTCTCACACACCVFVRRRNTEELHRSLETHTIATSPQPPSRIQVDDTIYPGRTNQT